MGHKINPDIFRLGVTKRWSFQLKSNRNFLRNLFLFKFLKNLFVNYSIPFFDFTKRRNEKFNDKLIFKGEQQLIPSLFVSSNVLFSHVYFGQIKDKLFIESFFIDVGFKQQRKLTVKAKRNEVLHLREYKRWDYRYYKSTVFRKNRLYKKRQQRLRKIFSSRRFHYLSKKFYRRFFSKRRKSLRKSLKDLHKFSLVVNPRYDRKLSKIFQIDKKLIPIKKLNSNQRYKFLGQLKSDYKKIFQKLKLRKVFFLEKKLSKLERSYQTFFSGKKLSKKLRSKESYKELKYDVRRKILSLKNYIKKVTFRKVLLRKRFIRLVRRKRFKQNLFFFNFYRNKLSKKKKLRRFFRFPKKKEEFIQEIKSKLIQFRRKNPYYRRIIRRRRTRAKTRYPVRRYRAIRYLNVNKSIGSFFYRGMYYKKHVWPRYFRITQKEPLLFGRSYYFNKGIPKLPLKFFTFIQKRKRYFFVKGYQNLKTLKYFIRYFKLINLIGLKKKIFFCHNLICLILNFIGIVNRTVLTKKLYFFIQSIILYSYSSSFLYYMHFRKKYFSKYIFFKGVSKTLFRSVLEMTNFNKVNFNIVGQNKFKFNSSLVLNYIITKLGQYFAINEIVNPLSYYIKFLTCILGYKILITGRLTRKERAAVMIRSGKRMPLSTISAPIDYSSGFKIMKFGMVGIKVYLFLKPSYLMNLYRFSFTYAKNTKQYNKKQKF